jgi:transposase-like protein
LARVKIAARQLTDIREAGAVRTAPAFFIGRSSGFPEVIGAVYAETIVQTDIAHLIHNSLKIVTWKHGRQVVPDLQAIAERPMRKPPRCG